MPQLMVWRSYIHKILAKYLQVWRLNQKMGIDCELPKKYNIDYDDLTRTNIVIKSSLNDELFIPSYNRTDFRHVILNGEKIAEIKYEKINGKRQIGG